MLFCVAWVIHKRKLQIFFYTCSEVWLTLIIFQLSCLSWVIFSVSWAYEDVSNHIFHSQFNQNKLVIPNRWQLIVKWAYFPKDFWYLLNSNILVSSEGIIALQKCLFSHTFLCDSRYFFSRGMETIQTIKITIIFSCYSS